MWLIYGDKEMKEKKVFSRKVIREGMLVQSRIYFILIAKNLCVYVRNIFYVETTMSDHSMIVMNFNTQVCERGLGVCIHKLSQSIDIENYEKLISVNMKMKNVQVPY